MKAGKHSVKDLECLFWACSVSLLLYTNLLAEIPLSTESQVGIGKRERDFAYAGARDVLRKVEKQTLHWMSLAVSLTLSWDLASLPAFLRARSRFCADLAPCASEHDGQRSAISRLGYEGWIGDG